VHVTYSLPSTQTSARSGGSAATSPTSSWTKSPTYTLWCVRTRGGVKLCVYLQSSKLPWCTVPTNWVSSRVSHGLAVPWP